ncbi:MAG: GNAT family N-acetyltransferase [Rhodobacteraceae bacterium]|jgi:ribosomal protein S18 acetylase RimI-like enzyme|nr:GNAT family N-acetyltransferase [Paracoccaceae bacterium]
MPESLVPFHIHDKSLASYWGSLATGDSGQLFASGSCSGSICGLPEGLFNPAVVSSQNTDDISGLVRQMRPELARRNLSSLWWVGRGAQDPATTKVLGSLGVKQIGETPAMECPLDPWRPAPLPEGLTIETVTGRKPRSAWGNFLCLCFELGEEIAEGYALVEEKMPDAERFGYERYLARLDGEPAGVALLNMEGGVAGVYCIATLPSARGRGVGAAVTRHTMARGKTLGATAALLQATEMGEPVYRKIGFKTVFHYQNYALEA